MGLVMQLPVRPVGSGATTSVDPANAPLVTLAVTVGTTATSVALHVIVEVSPLFQVIGSVPLAFPASPPGPRRVQPSVPVPATLPVAPKYGTPVSTDEQGVAEEIAVPAEAVPVICTGCESSVSPGLKLIVADNGQMRSTGVADAAAPEPTTGSATIVATNARSTSRLMAHSPQGYQQLS